MESNRLRYKKVGAGFKTTEDSRAARALAQREYRSERRDRALLSRRNIDPSADPSPATARLLPATAAVAKIRAKFATFNATYGNSDAAVLQPSNVEEAKVGPIAPTHVVHNEKRSANTIDKQTLELMTKERMERLKIYKMRKQRRLERERQNRQPNFWLGKALNEPKVLLLKPADRDTSRSMPRTPGGADRAPIWHTGFSSLSKKNPPPPPSSGRRQAVGSSITKGSMKAGRSLFRGNTPSEGPARAGSSSARPNQQQTRAATTRGRRVVHNTAVDGEEHFTAAGEVSFAPDGFLFKAPGGLQQLTTVHQPGTPRRPSTIRFSKTPLPVTPTSGLKKRMPLMKTPLPGTSASPRRGRRSAGHSTSFAARGSKLAPTPVQPQCKTQSQPEVGAQPGCSTQFHSEEEESGVNDLDACAGSGSELVEMSPPTVARVMTRNPVHYTSVASDIHPHASDASSENGCGDVQSLEGLSDGLDGDNNEADMRDSSEQSHNESSTSSQCIPDEKERSVVVSTSVQSPSSGSLLKSSSAQRIGRRQSLNRSSSNTGAAVVLASIQTPPAGVSRRSSLSKTPVSTSVAVTTMSSTKSVTPRAVTGRKSREGPFIVTEVAASSLNSSVINVCEPATSSANSERESDEAFSANNDDIGCSPRLPSRPSTSNKILSDSSKLTPLVKRTSIFPPSSSNDCHISTNLTEKSEESIHRSLDSSNLDEVAPQSSNSTHNSAKSTIESPHSKSRQTSSSSNTASSDDRLPSTESFTPEPVATPRHTSVRRSTRLSSAQLQEGGACVTPRNMSQRLAARTPCSRSTRRSQAVHADATWQEISVATTPAVRPRRNTAQLALSSAQEEDVSVAAVTPATRRGRRKTTSVLNDEQAAEKVVNEEEQLPTPTAMSSTPANKSKRGRRKTTQAVINQDVQDDVNVNVVEQASSPVLLLQSESDGSSSDSSTSSDGSNCMNYLSLPSPSVCSTPFHPTPHRSGKKLIKPPEKLKKRVGMLLKLSESMNGREVVGTGPADGRGGFTTTELSRSFHVLSTYRSELKDNLGNLMPSRRSSSVSPSYASAHHSNNVPRHSLSAGVPPPTTTTNSPSNPSCSVGCVPGSNSSSSAGGGSSKRSRSRVSWMVRESPFINREPRSAKRKASVRSPRVEDMLPDAADYEAAVASCSFSSVSSAVTPAMAELLRPTTPRSPEVASPNVWSDLSDMEVDEHSPVAAARPDSAAQEVTPAAANKRRSRSAKRLSLRRSVLDQENMPPPHVGSNSRVSLGLFAPNQSPSVQAAPLLLLPGEDLISWETPPKAPAAGVRGRRSRVSVLTALYEDTPEATISLTPHSSTSSSATPRSQARKAAALTPGNVRRSSRLSVQPSPM